MTGRYLPHDNLAGPPIRFSKAVEAGAAGRRRFDGVIKFRLAHSEGRSYLTPEVLIGVGGTRFFFPSMFGPPRFGFNVEEGLHVVIFDFDTGTPVAAELSRIVVQVRSDARLFAYADGAQLYRCTFEGPRHIARVASGLCTQTGAGDYRLRLYHHTTPEAAAGIAESATLRSSSWNLAGTRQLENVSYAYLTTLPEVSSEADLHRIAMASNGRLTLQTTSDRALEEVLSLQVYRGDTTGRTVALPFDVPLELLAPPHLLLHPLTRREAAYYEVVGPEICRIGLRPARGLALADGAVSAAEDDLKTFDYLVLGDASSVEGLAAPYDEEETRDVAHLERLGEQSAFDYWQANANQDLITGRVFEPRRLQPDPGAG
jgi:hypothetical protein